MSSSPEWVRERERERKSDCFVQSNGQHKPFFLSFPPLKKKKHTHIWSQSLYTSGQKQLDSSTFHVIIMKIIYFPWLSHLVTQLCRKLKRNLKCRSLLDSSVSDLRDKCFSVFQNREKRKNRYHGCVLLGSPRSLIFLTCPGGWGREIRMAQVWKDLSGNPGGGYKEFSTRWNFNSLTSVVRTLLRGTELNIPQPKQKKRFGSYNWEIEGGESGQTRLIPRSPSMRLLFLSLCLSQH